MFRFKKFTLIELIVVIAILAILAGIIIPNIKNIKDDAQETSFIGNQKNTQTAVDMYLIENKSYPSYTQPKVGVPSELDFSKLIPKYIIKRPKENNFYVWADVFKGSVYSYVDAPIGLKNESGTLSWNEVIDAKSYNIYEINTVTGVANYKITKVSEVLGNETSLSGLSSDKEYLISAVDFKGNETPMVNGSYLGIEKYSTIHSPVPKIVMNPSATDFIGVGDHIDWSYTFIDKDGDTIQNVEWEGKQDSYNAEGVYTVKLRVQDTKGLWSDWTEQTFSVVSMTSVKKVSVSGDFSIMLMENGTVKSFGLNNYGQLGYFTSTDKNPTPTTIPNVAGVKDIATGGFHTVLLMNDGTVKTFGYNQYGQLGYSTNAGTGNINLTPTTIPDVNDVKSISAGYYHTVLLMNDGTVKTFGYNQYGQLGYTANAGTANVSFNPKTISGISDVASISAGGSSTFLLMNDGTVKSFGRNTTGQLGYTIALGGYNDQPTTIPNISGVKSIAVGNLHTLLLMNDGTVKTFGLNTIGQLGYTANVLSNNPNPTPTTIPNISGVQEVSAGNDHSILLMSDGTLRSFGSNRYGQLGYEINSGTTNANWTPRPVTGVSNVSGISGGANHTLVLMKDHSVKSFGRNYNGQLGYSLNSGSSVSNFVANIIVLN